MLFLLDEMAHRGLLRFFEAQGHKAKLVPKGLSNGAVTALAVAEGRIILTHDADFSNEAPAFDHPGIILIRIPPRDFEGLKSSLSRLLSEKDSPASFVNRLFLLFKDRYDDFPFRSEEIPL